MRQGQRVGGRGWGCGGGGDGVLDVCVGGVGGGSESRDSEVQSGLGAAARVRARVRIRCGTCACAWRAVCGRDASMCKSEMAGVAVEVGEWGRGELRTCAASACGAGASS